MQKQTDLPNSHCKDDTVILARNKERYQSKKTAFHKLISYYLNVIEKLEK